MHEVSIALAILQEITERSYGEDWKAVRTVRVRVGALTAVVPEALAFAWELAADGTIAQGSSLDIECLPLVVHCDACATERTLTETMVPCCPSCGRGANIVSGRELEIVSLEVDDADSPR
jgi:hydrogenase nickel incorporation protein HypA/HybF